MLYIFLSFTATIATFLIVYTWIFFPLLVILLAKSFNNKNKFQNNETNKIFKISVIVSAYNEEKNIKKKLINLFEQDYPLSHLEIIVASDGSIDRTNDIVREFNNVKLLDFKKNRGKAIINNDAAKVANGEILFFTDAETILANDYISNASNFFINQKYGCGSGNYTFHSAEAFGKSESLYWKIEKTIRESEYRIGILPFASGGCMMIRKELYKEIPSHSDIDNILPLFIISKGMKVFYANDAKAFDMAVNSEISHFNKRLRTTQRSLADIVSYLPKLINGGYYTITFTIFSHRILRWFTGILLLIVLLSSIVLSEFEKGFSSMWNIYLLMQILFYFLGLNGFIKERTKINFSFFNRIISFIYSFILANISFTIAILKILFGQKIRSWKSI